MNPSQTSINNRPDLGGVRFKEDVFQPSSTPSMGVEVELQVLDRETGELVPGARRILEACAREQVAGVSGEFLLSMIEIRTGICREIAEVERDLSTVLNRVRKVATSLGYDLAFAGTHPLARPSASVIAPDDRYEQIRKRQGWLAYEEITFGMHIHIGVPGGDAAVGLMNYLVPYLPHLLALSANSPFWQGLDTDFASSRAVMFRPSPHSGIPPRFRDWEACRKHCHILAECGAVEATKDLYWDIRPRPVLGTIEFRIFDVPPTRAALLGLVVLTRSLVVDALRRLQDSPQLIQGDRWLFPLALENRWRAARFGLEAQCLRQPGGQVSSLAEDTDLLIDQLGPIADEIGGSAFLHAITPSGGFQSGAARQRRIYRESGTWQAVIQALKTGWEATGEVAA